MACGEREVRSNFERYQRIAPLYDALDLAFETRRYRRIRPLLFERLSGRVLDAGVGTGRNIAYYPAGATVLGIDISPAMLARAEARRARSPASVALRRMDVTRLDLADDSFDAAVASFLFCVLPDEAQALALRELRRVVRNGGEVRLLDYVRPRGMMRRALVKIWEPWTAWAYGASFDRDTEAHIVSAGLKVAEARYVVDDLVKLVKAVAVKPR